MQIIEIGRVETEDGWTVTEQQVQDDGTATVVERTEFKTPVEEVNREALADLLHTTLARIANRDDIDTDVATALLLLHRFVHADYTDAEV